MEQLVDELCEKLQHIEQQNTDVNNTDAPLLATLSVANISVVHDDNAIDQADFVNNASASVRDISSRSGEKTNSEFAQQSLGQQKQRNTCSSLLSQQQQQGNYSATPLISATSAAVATAADITSVVKDLETDPKKRYFRAFPALSKEMEDSFRIWRRNAKSLTWPVDRSNISSVISSSSSNSSQNSSSSSNSAISTSLNSVKDAHRFAANFSAGAGEFRGDIEGNLENIKDNSSAAGLSATGAGGVKRKSKRRRNQGK